MLPETHHETYLIDILRFGGKIQGVFKMSLRHLKTFHLTADDTVNPSILPILSFSDNKIVCVCVCMHDWVCARFLII